ncbi:MAG: hypothetical protein KGN34_09570 [Sphingomonadales bacterium]|nr:hypothetical protein [Sphingomonadales bacterium]
MEMWFIGNGIALCLFALWAIGRRDWVRLTRPSRRVNGLVSGHRSKRDEGEISYAAIYRFTAEDGPHEVVDASYGTLRDPPVGTVRELVYPEGRPDLAQPPRVALWITVYALLLAMLGMLVAKALGWLPGH